MRITTPKLILALTTAAVLFAGLGCNTVKGAGEDVQTGGEKIQDAAQNTQDKMK